MSDCCRTSGVLPRKRRCPASGGECVAVSPRTIAHHLHSPWLWSAKSQGYYVCEDPACDIVYFGEDDSVIRRAQLRTVVGTKDRSPDALLCYCFGVSTSQALSNPAIRDYITGQTRNGLCSCETSNPLGRCCLKDFPRAGQGGE